MEPEDDNPHPDPPYHVRGLPVRVLETYARLWQLETWLRELVYVQLRAKAGDAWEECVRRASGSKSNDKRLIHMPTPEESLLSYAQLSTIRSIIAENWVMFDSFLPPKLMWEAKLDEVLQIRHRGAHFRATHTDDLSRVVQLMRDIDKGLWRLCTSYNDPIPVLPPSADPVVAAFQHLDCFPWTLSGTKHWGRTGYADPSIKLMVTIEVLPMPWAEWELPIAGREGFLYDVHFYARDHWGFDYGRLLQRTSQLHRHIAHLRLDGGLKSLHVTIPAVLGAEQVTTIVNGVHEAALSTLKSHVDFEAEEKVQRVADSQPEYVLGPSHPMTFLTPEMPCSIFEI